MDDNSIDIAINFFRNNNIKNHQIIKQETTNGVFYNRALLLETQNSDYAFFIDDDTVDNNIITKFNFISTYNYDLIFLKRLYCYKEKSINLEEKHGINVKIQILQNLFIINKKICMLLEVLLNMN